MIKAIPKKLLIHSINIIDQETKVSYPIGNVLVQLKQIMTFNNAGEQVVSNSILYIDTKNSVYTNLDSVVLDNIVEFNNHRYIIKGVEYSTGFGLHHLEVHIV